MSEKPKDNSQQPTDDRRESPRVSMRFLVKRAGTSGAFESREGNLSLGGFAWYGAALSVGTKVEARFSLPDSGGEIQVSGEVLHVGHGSRGSCAHVRFLDLPVEVELRIARYLDEVELVESKSRGGT
jgi:hypothetical protein